MSTGAEPMIAMRPYQDHDWPHVWELLAPVFRAGETYAFSPDITEEEAYRVWIQVPSETYVAIDQENRIVGTYYLKPNQPGLGDHVCNCGYVVSTASRRQGIASTMCQHSQRVALERGFLAMQYNLVVATNEEAIRLWRKQGFEVIGTLPEAFRHPRLGLVDALVMYKRLR